MGQKSSSKVQVFEIDCVRGCRKLRLEGIRDECIRKLFNLDSNIPVQTEVRLLKWIGQTARINKYEP